MGAGARLVPFFLPLGVGRLLDVCSILRQQKAERVCFPGTAASLASKSAASFRGTWQCPGVHCSRIDVPWVLVFLASRRMAWVICRPDLFPWFWTASSADLLSLRMVAVLARVRDVLQCRRATLLMILIAYRIPNSSAAGTDHRSMGPTCICMLSIISSEPFSAAAAAPR
jgi:hypothetical protein